MSRYRLDLKINRYLLSNDYGKPYGFAIFDRKQNKVVQNGLMHDLDFYCKVYKIKRKK